MGYTAPQLFAISQGNNHIAGDDRCHWCGSPCPRKWPHDDAGTNLHYVAPINTDPSSNLYRKRTTAKCPGNSYICIGCSIYRRKRVTVNFMGGGLKDRQEPRHHSWWVDTTGGWAVNKQCAEDMCLRLMMPPHQFVLSLLTDDCKENLIHLAVANDLVEIKADTPLTYTLNNKPLEYTIYEFEEAMKHGTEGKSPGVRALFDFFGIYTIATNRVEEIQEVKRKRGRPPKVQPPSNESVNRLVTGRSG